MYASAHTFQQGTAILIPLGAKAVASRNSGPDDKTRNMNNALVTPDSITQSGPLDDPLPKHMIPASTTELAGSLP